MKKLGAALAASLVHVSLAFAGPAPILVDARDDLTKEQLLSLEEQYGVDLSPNSLYSGASQLYRADHFEGDSQALLEKLAADPRIEAAEEEERYEISMEPDDPSYKYQWHFQQIHMPDAWDTTQGKDVIVAVIDTGVAYEDYKDSLGQYHEVEDLKGIRFVPGYDFVNNDAHANDDHCHGTHVAGTIAQATNNGIGVAGIAHRAAIMPLKVLSKQGFGQTADIADAIRFAADHGAQVINMSLGGGFPSKIMREAIHYAHKKGVVVVAAAGNNGQRKVSYPAAYPDTIAVSATRYDKTLTWYSNWGTEIDLAAPGGDTRVDQNGDGYPDGVLQNTIAVGDPTTEGYFLFQGTSMASPHVAGVAALVMSLGVRDPDKVEEILKKTAQKQGPGDWNDKYGAGIVDAASAVSKAAALRSPFGVTALRSPLFLSVFFPLAWISLLAGFAPCRRALKGLTLLFSAYLLGQAFGGGIDVAWIPDWFGSSLDRAWLALNGLLGVGLASLLRAKR